MNYLIILFILAISLILWIIGASLQKPIYNKNKDAYELDVKNNIIGSYFIITVLLLIFIAGRVLDCTIFS